MEYALLVMRLRLVSRDPIDEYTGKLSKTILAAEVPEIESVFRPVKGLFKPFRVSPPLDSGLNGVYPVIARDSGLKPVKLEGEYTVEVGCEERLAREVRERLSGALGQATRLKFRNTMVKYTIESVDLVKPRISVSDSFVVRIASPALLSDPFKVNQQVKRFAIAPSIVLWIPALIAQGILTPTPHDIARAVSALESTLTEHYSSKPRAVLTSYDGHRVAGLTGRIKYLVVNKDGVEHLQKTLEVARVLGVGSSRASGFGTIQVITGQHRQTA